MPHKLSALVNNLSNVFNKDPLPLDAMQVVFPFGANWVIDNRVLYTVVPQGRTALRIELTGKTITQVVTAINAVTDYSATVLNNTGNLSAYSLIEAQYPSVSGAAIKIPLHTSPLYQLLSAMALPMDQLEDDLVEAFEQVKLSQANSVWLDQWGKVYGTPRLPNEPDLLYSRRINESVVAIKANGPSIVAILKRVAGIDSSITAEGPATFTIETVLSDTAPLSSYSLGDISGMIRSWKAFGVVVSVNFTTFGSELYLATTGTDFLIDTTIPNASGFQWGLPEFGLTEFG